MSAPVSGRAFCFCKASLALRFRSPSVEEDVYKRQLLTCVFLLLALYQQAAFFYRRPHPRRFILFAVLGLAFGGASRADGLALVGAVVTAAFLLCTLGGLTALSYSRFAPGAAGERAQDPTVR